MGMKLGLAICPHLKRAKALEVLEPLHLGTNDLKSFSINASQFEQLLAGVGESPCPTGLDPNVTMHHVGFFESKQVGAVERVFQPVPVLGTFQHGVYLLPLA